MKYNGFRTLCYLEQGRCRLVSRNGNPMSRFAALREQVAASLDVGDAVLDGEVIAPDETGRPQFHDLLRHTRVPAYVAFDNIVTGRRSLFAITIRLGMEAYAAHAPRHHNADKDRGLLVF